jgi:hypothetical protein
MAAITEELSLRYLLELSTDIRVAFLLGDGGELVASAPDPPPEQIARVCAELAREARSLARGEPAVEIDVNVDGGTAFVVWEGGPTMVCVTGPFALPGLILHDMRMALTDLRRGGEKESGS